MNGSRRGKPLVSWLLPLCLALLLVAVTIVSYPVALVARVTLGTLLLASAIATGRWVWSRRSSGTILSDRSYSSLVIFLIVFSATSTVQVLAAREIYGSQRAIDGTPGYLLVVTFVHCTVAASAILLGRRSAPEIGLGAAMVYTSLLYTPAFETPEAAPPFVSLGALALALLVSVGRSGLPVRGFRALPLLAFIAIATGATLLSSSRSDSAVWLYKLLVLLIFAWLIPTIARTPATWKRMVWAVVLVSVVTPALFSVAKQASLLSQLDPWAVSRYRLALTELGRYNLIARSLVTGLPLLISTVLSEGGRRQRLWWWILLLLGVLALILCESWSGWIGLGLGLAFAAGLRAGKPWLERWRTHRSGLGWYAVNAAVLILGIVGVLVVLRLAPEARSVSFNGRLLRYASALQAIPDHALLGTGPSNHYLISGYYLGLDWPVMTQAAWDDPLRPPRLLAEASAMHTHSLFLEIALGMGVPALLAFAWFLIDIFRFGLRTRGQLTGQGRLLLTGCLAGIVASIGWGLIDVMSISPPFFTFPTWALVGLVLAAPRALGVEDGQRAKDSAPARPAQQESTRRPRLSHPVARALQLTALLLVVALAVVVPLAGNLHYRQGFAAYQQRSWGDAVEAFARASRWEPLNAKYHQLRGEALINLGRYDQAIAAYEKATRLKREFAPYHAQLGWLYWLQGDLATATAHFEGAVEMDPREAWRDGLHADLALAYVAQGRRQEALPLLAETIKLDPAMAQAPDWAPVQAAGGGIEIVLDPVYLAGSSQELEKRILEHLGKGDYTARILEPSAGSRGAISLGEVLDVIEAEYQAAHADGGREAPRLLATVAEAARSAGLDGRAERTYLAFQTAFPQSAFGFRDLGTLYRGQGRLQESQEQLAQAVLVSPRDVDSWLALAEVYLAQGLGDEAGKALAAARRLEPLDPHLYELQAQLYEAGGEPGKAAGALRKALAIEESIPNRLALASLYRDLGQPAQASGECLQAWEALARTWPRPLDPQLREIGTCLAQSAEDDLPQRVSRIAQQQPLAGNVLVGQFHQAQGNLGQALAAYQAAAAARPGKAAPHYFLAETFRALGQPDQAEAEYHQAAQLDPLESLPLVALGRMQAAQGRQAEALETYRAAVGATPGWGPAQVTLGNALLAQGEREAAAEHFQKALLADRNLQEGLVYDFAAQLASAQVQAPGMEYVRNDYFSIDGDERRVLFMHPQSSAAYVIDVPPGCKLAFAMALSPDSWQQPGDGVTFSISVQTGAGTAQIFSTYIDPKREEADRHWLPHTVDLGEYAGQEVTVRFETGPGPAGDVRFDWAGWAVPQLLVP